MQRESTSTVDEPKPRRFPRLPFALKILIAMLLGIVCGELLGTRAEPLSQLGTVILDLIKGLAGPLLLFAIVDAFLRTKIQRVPGP